MSADAAQRERGERQPDDDARIRLRGVACRRIRRRRAGVGGRASPRVADVGRNRRHGRLGAGDQPTLGRQQASPLDDALVADGGGGVVADGGEARRCLDESGGGGAPLCLQCGRNRIIFVASLPLVRALVVFLSLFFMGAFFLGTKQLFGLKSAFLALIIFWFRREKNDLRPEKKQY